MQNTAKQNCTGSVTYYDGHLAGNEMGRAVPDFGSGRNPALSKSGRNPAPAKIPPEPDSLAGFEKSIFSDIIHSRPRMSN